VDTATPLLRIVDQLNQCQTLDLDLDSTLEPLPKLKGKARETIQVEKQDDLEFVIIYRQNMIGKMNWKTYLEVGHNDDLCVIFVEDKSIK
jgi:hypothetical protein